jgi:hypothetical protein
MSERSYLSAGSSFSAAGSDARHTTTGSPSKHDKVATNGHNSAYRSQAATNSTPPRSQAVIYDVFSAPSQSSVVQKKEDVAQEPSVEFSGTALQHFLSSADLNTTIIAHNSSIQALLDENRISWGVQFELARGVTTGHWTWDAVEDKIGELTGSNAKAAQRVRSVMLNVPQKAPDLTIWYVHILPDLDASCV